MIPAMIALAIVTVAIVGLVLLVLRYVIPVSTRGQVDALADEARATLAQQPARMHHEVTDHRGSRPRDCSGTLGVLQLPGQQ